MVDKELNLGRNAESQQLAISPPSERGSEKFSWKRLLGASSLFYLTTLTAMAALAIDGAVLAGRPPETVLQFLNNQNSVDTPTGLAIGSGIWLGLALGMFTSSIIDSIINPSSPRFRVLDSFRRS